MSCSKQFADLVTCLMRKLYWKIFISFWIASILIIGSTAWVTGKIAQKSSILKRTYVFMDSYANAAVATYEFSGIPALKQWLQQISANNHMKLYLLTNDGSIISNLSTSPQVQHLSTQFSNGNLKAGILESESIIVSHQIPGKEDVSYRLAAISDKQLADYIAIPWVGLGFRLFFTIFISGLLCYLLSIYLTKPLRKLRYAAQQIASGKLNTRIGHIAGHSKDELAELGTEFDLMAEQIEVLLTTNKRLLQDISHELRSPLARLRMAIELGRKKTKQLAESEFARMESECIRLNELITEILESARVNQPTATYNPTRINLAAFIQQIIDDANFEFSSKAPRVITKEIQDISLFFDSVLLRRAIENILRNALAYSPENKPVEVSIKKQHERIIIEIKDYGPGVPEEQLLNIFNPFYRVDTARTRKKGGYGLGLSIAQQAIACQGGKIEAMNHEEGGLTMQLSFS